MRVRPPALLLSALLVLPAFAQEPVDLDVVTRIRLEGYHRSKAKEILSEMCDVVGPRLTGSPSYRKASGWAQKKMSDWGLANVHAESFAPFGRGWTYGKTAVTMRAPETAVLAALPKAWTPGTNGPKRGTVVFAKLEKAEDLEKWKGKLAGKVVLLDDAPERKPREKADVQRYTAERLEEVARFETNVRYGGPRRDRKKFIEERDFAEKRLKFLSEEKALASITASRGEDGTIFVQQGASWEEGKPSGPTALSMAAEAYGRLFRLVKMKKEVELEIEVEAAFTDPDPEAAANVLGEIPGTDRKGEVVMLGGHLDSWHGGTGATDDGAGVAIAMEAIRILKVLDLHPKRTIRVALWGGEEQGLLGSRAYVARHFASRPEPTDPEEKKLPGWMRRDAGPLTFHPEWKTLAGYFNVDNGAGKIRGIYTQENAAARPIFEAWLEPLKDLGATALTNRSTGGTDHLSFDAVGLPGFQFIQDELDYETRTHHSNVDVVERAPDADLQEAAVVLASFVWEAASRPAMLPRKPVPPARPREEDAEERAEAKPSEAAPHDAKSAETRPADAKPAAPKP